MIYDSSPLGLYDTDDVSDDGEAILVIGSLALTVMAALSAPVVAAGIYMHKRLKMVCNKR